MLLGVDSLRWFVPVGLKGEGRGEEGECSTDMSRVGFNFEGLRGDCIVHCALCFLGGGVFSGCRLEDTLFKLRLWSCLH